MKKGLLGGPSCLLQHLHHLEGTSFEIGRVHRQITLPRMLKEKTKCRVKVMATT